MLEVELVVIVRAQVQPHAPAGCFMLAHGGCERGEERAEEGGVEEGGVRSARGGDAADAADHSEDGRLCRRAV